MFLKIWLSPEPLTKVYVKTDFTGIKLLIWKRCRDHLSRQTQALKTDSKQEKSLTSTERKKGYSVSVAEACQCTALCWKAASFRKWHAGWVLWAFSWSERQTNLPALSTNHRRLLPWEWAQAVFLLTEARLSSSTTSTAPRCSDSNCFSHLPIVAYVLLSWWINGAPAGQVCFDFGLVVCRFFSFFLLLLLLLFFKSAFFKLELLQRVQNLKPSCNTNNNTSSLCSLAKLFVYYFILSWFFPCFWFCSLKQFAVWRQRWKQFSVNFSESSLTSRNNKCDLTEVPRRGTDWFCITKSQTYCSLSKRNTSSEYRPPRLPSFSQFYSRHLLTHHSPAQQLTCGNSHFIVVTEIIQKVWK